MTYGDIKVLNYSSWPFLTNGYFLKQHADFKHHPIAVISSLFRLSVVKYTSLPLAIHPV